MINPIIALRTTADTNEPSQSYPLDYLIMSTIYATIHNTKYAGWDYIEDTLVSDEEDFIEQYENLTGQPLSNGTPSADLFRSVFSFLTPSDFVANNKKMLLAIFGESTFNKISSGEISLAGIKKRKF